MHINRTYVCILSFHCLKIISTVLEDLCLSFSLSQMRMMTTMMMRTLRMKMNGRTSDFSSFFFFSPSPNSWLIQTLKLFSSFLKEIFNFKIINVNVLSILLYIFVAFMLFY